MPSARTVAATRGWAGPKYGRLPLRLWASVVALLAGVFAGPATGQQQNALGEGVQPVMVRELTRGIERAEASIAAGEYVQALRFLDELLGREDDSFVRVADEGGAYVGLKRRAAEILRALPAAGREAYLAAFAPVAARELREALSSGELARLRAVVRRYGMTPPGQDAALLLAQRELDAGRRFAAALLYDQLLADGTARERFEPQLSVLAAMAWQAAGDADRAAAIWESAPGGRLPIAGRPEQLPSGQAQLSMVAEMVGPAADDFARADDDWLTFGGDLTRNSATQGGLPHLRMRWQARTLPHPELETAYEEMAADLRQSGRFTPIAARPLAVGDQLVVRTAHTIYGVDFSTGKLLWRADPSEAIDLERLLPREPVGDGRSRGDNAAAMNFAKRTWENYLSGLISSDGRRVYAVRGLGRTVSSDDDIWQQGPFGGAVSVGSESANRLCAYDLAENGRRAWQIDGADLDGALPGACFLGAPLCVGNVAYALVDMRDEVSLLAIDAATGDIQWRQPLASLDYFIAFDEDRRLSGAMPSFADGILVCPTGGGIVVGYDLAEQSLAWAYQYRRQGDGPRYARRGNQAGQDGPAATWTQSAATIAEGRVLLTPPESDQLHCLDLRTGELLWTQDRADMLSVACVDQGRILLVGNKKATALGLDDGKPAWATSSLRWPDDALPGGTGFLSQGRYYVPLSNGEVVAVDLSDGKIAARCGGRDAPILGNLICHRGAVLSQSGRYLERYDQVEALRTEAADALAANPQDAEALRLLGEIALGEGRTSDAIEHLERAYRLDPDSGDVQEVLTEALADALLGDFVSYRSKLPLLEKLQDGSIERQFALLRIRARGLLKVGEPLSAGAACLQLYRLVDDRSEPLELAADYTTAPHRWLRAQLGAVYRACDDQQRAELLASVDRLREQLAADEGGEQTARFLDCFEEFPGSDALRLARAAWLGKHRLNLAAQQTLLPMADDADPARRGEAIRRIAEGLVGAGQTAVAARFARAHEAAPEGWADASAELQQQLAFAADQLQSLSWPQGVATASIQGKRTASSGYSRTRMPLAGVGLDRTDAILSGCTVSLASRGSELLVRDSLGRLIFQTQLPGESRSAFYRRAGMAYGVSCGSLLVISQGDRLAAFNCLADEDDPAGSLLWQTSVVSGFDQQSASLDASGDSWQRPGSYRPTRASIDGRWTGVIGPVTSTGVIYQDQRRLTCVDPLTGVVLWQRGDAPLGCDLYGDEQLVFAVPRTSRQATVYSAIDGRKLGSRPVPSWREQLATRGRVVIAWKAQADDALLVAVDAWTGEELWSHRFAQDAHVDVDVGEMAAVAEPSGRVVLVDMADGSLVADYQGPALRSFDTVHLLAGFDAVTVMVSRAAAGGEQRRISPFNTLDYPAINGFAYVFDRADGQMRWNRPAQLRQQAFMLTQGRDLPAILFASGLSTRNGQGSRMRTSMLLLDKATGRTVMRADDLDSAAGGYCQPFVAESDDDADRQLAIEMSSQNVAVRFTDRPRAPAPPAMDEVESGMDDSRGGLTNLLKRAVNAVE